MKARAVWRHKGYEHLQHFAANNPKEAFRAENTRNALLKQEMETAMYREVCG